MIEIKKSVNQELENLTEEQLRQVADFIAFIKFQARLINLKVKENQLASLYSEFNEDDRMLAEEGIEDYAEMLRRED